MSQRIDWIDTARGIGIVLVVFCHLYFDYTRTFIYSFLMPLFFFIAGLLYNNSKYFTLKSFIISRFRKLMYPYFLWSSLLFLFWLLFDVGDYSIFKNFLGIFLGTGGHEYMDWGVMMWFLPCLFLTELLYYILLKVKSINISLCVILCSAIGFTINRYFDIHFPWSFQIAIVLILFYHIGNRLRDVLMERIVKARQLLLIIPATLIWFFSSYYNGEIYAYQGQFNNPFLFIISGISGVSMIILLAFWIQRLRFLSLIGRHTMLIFLAHLRALTIVKGVQVFVLGIDLNQSFGISLLYIVLVIALLVPASIFISKKIPFLLHFPYEKHCTKIQS
ncbi:hypothetical protein DMA11_08580 [Marinilabiliaceae bacterium JC017]|nr:hypothetical protein DMA11_08580 [Marinilabiliaceae bacterium JC017]